MGQEASVTGTWNGSASPGKALLETDHLLFRGDVRVKLMLADLLSVEQSGEALAVATADGTLSLELGAKKAADWLNRIRNPKSVLDKLGLKPGVTVALRGTPDPVLAAELTRAGIAGDGGTGADLVLLVADRVEELAAVADIAATLAPKAGLWIIYPKRRRDITQDDVFAAGRGAGLVDNKVCGVSPTHTALKFVRRKA